LKSLLLVRHAKSDWADASLKDFDRPLNDRGKRDAPVMAHRMLDKKIKIDAFIASPAKRAKKTAELFASEYRKDKKEVIFFEELYLADPESFFKVIEQTDDDFSSIAVFSHNEGITQFANQLSDVRVDDMPTCSIFAVKMKLKKWKDFREAEKEFWFFDYPKSNQH
jgi:phosphohistidine phosphatase